MYRYILKSKITNNIIKRYYCNSNSSNNNSNNNKKVVDFYDDENPETQTFNWLSNRTEKKVNAYVKPTTTTITIINEKEIKPKVEETKSFEKKYEHYLNLLGDDIQREELKNASNEIIANSPIDRANLSFTTLIRVCGKLSDEESRIKEVVKRLLSLNNINVTTTPQNEILKVCFTIDQAITVMSDYLLRSNSTMVEQVFKFIQSNKDRFTISTPSSLNQIYYLMIESFALDGNHAKCKLLYEELKCNSPLDTIDNCKINRLICMGYSNSNQPELALSHWEQLKNQSDKNDIVILNSILNCFSRQSKIDKMESLFTNIIAPASIINYNTIQYLIEGYLRVGNLNKSIEIISSNNDSQYSSLPTTTQSFNQIFTKLGKQSRLDEMITLFEQVMMKPGKQIVESLPIELDFDKLANSSDEITTNFIPNINTINILIDACCQCNNIDMAYQLFNTLLPRFNLKASSETYSILEAISFKLKRNDLYRKYCVDYFHIIKKD